MPVVHGRGYAGLSSLSRLAGGLVVLVLLAGCAQGAAPGPAPTTTLRSLPTLAATELPNSMDCLVVSSQATPDATEPSIFPPAGASDHIQGAETPSVTFLEYTDLQVGASAGLDAVLTELVKRYPQDVRRVFRHFPLSYSDKGMLAAAAAEAAGKQNKFWEMSALLTDKQADWTKLDGAAFQDWLAQQAQGIGLDEKQFTQDIRDPQIKTALDQAQHFGLTSGMATMPFLLVNGRIYQGPRDLRSLDSLVKLLRMQSHQFSECPPFVIDPAKEYFADVQTSKGKIVLQLFPKEAPLSVNNFVFLSRQGWFDGVMFHRVIKDSLAQAGDPSGTGFGSPGYAFPDEIGSLLFDKPGLLAMANAGPNSNGSQFFITLRAMPDLNGKYTIFGQVVEGMDVLAQLTPRDPSLAADLPNGDTILKVEIREQQAK
jgi:cyclophilin family peptidyl-prolyl cis-trans isomerase/protein-disulfide isomerase